MPNILKEYKMGDLDEVSTKPDRPANNLPADEVGGQNVDMPKKSTNMEDKGVFKKADERDYDK